MQFKAEHSAKPRGHLAPGQRMLGMSGKTRIPRCYPNRGSLDCAYRIHWWLFRVIV